MPTALAQIEMVKPLAEGLGANLPTYGLALALVTIGVLFKMLWDQNAKHALALETMNKAQDLEVANLRTAHATEIAALNAALLAQARDDASEQRKLMAQIVPLSGQLVEMIRLTDRE